MPVYVCSPLLLSGVRLRVAGRHVFAVSCFDRWELADVVVCRNSAACSYLKLCG